MPKAEKAAAKNGGPRLLRRWDALPLLAAAALAAAGGFAALGGGGRQVKVLVENKVVWQQPLTANAEYLVQTKYGQNTVVVQNGSCFVKNADCRDAICQKSGKISRRGQSIVCLPHRLVVEVE